MSSKFILSNDVKSQFEKALLKSAEAQHTETEQLLLELIREASQDADRYFLYLYYGEFLMERGRWEDSRDFLMRSAQIALNRKDHRGLAFSHERLGDLSAGEGNWFGTLHHYRYALRMGGSFLDGSAVEMLEAKASAARSTLHNTVLSSNATIIPLDREYVSGNMAVSFVHRDIFLKNYFARCLECNFCHDWCCSFGADVDIQNVERIQQHREEILPFIRPSEVEWFEAEYTYYEEYAGNLYTRINPQGPRCVFISKDQRGCGLHRYAISKQMDYHEIKPLVCILFPLSFEEGILSLASELDDDSLICSGSGDSSYRSLRNEVEYYFGRELVEELDRIEKKVLVER
ncbi:MAG TPA: YkgJ family cysteine cluster protein [Anaerolineales bacterium]|nr:YkgJ family cysteine cluster protein [Anaerolineales bacterium]